MSTPHVLSKAGASKAIISKIIGQKMDVRGNPYDAIRRAGGSIDVADRVAVHFRFPLTKRVLGHAEWILAQRRHADGSPSIFHGNAAGHGPRDDR